MSWTYEQVSGRLLDPSGILVAIGYSGHLQGLNNPSMQAVANVGPIPVGTYKIGAPIDSPTHGPFALPLTPDQWTNIYGRFAFMIHGDEVAHAGQHLASEGCIILPRLIREQIFASPDHVLDVVSGQAPQVLST